MTLLRLQVLGFALALNNIFTLISLSAVLSAAPYPVALSPTSSPLIPIRLSGPGAFPVLASLGLVLLLSSDPGREQKTDVCLLAEGRSSSAKIRPTQSCNCPRPIGCNLIECMEAGHFQDPQEPPGVPGVELTVYSRVEKLVLTVPLVRGPLAAYTVTV